jgi:acetylornithine deacetylase/succinyl-diaminopimelate desuccinylase-like protein
MHAGYVGDGYANIVPGSAVAHLNVRLVVGQDPGEVWQSVLAAARAATPRFAKVDGELGETLRAVGLDVDSPPARRAVRTLEAVCGEPAEIFHGPGGLPALEALVASYGEDAIVSVGLANSDARPHGSDENLSLAAISTGLAWSTAFLEQPTS